MRTLVQSRLDYTPPPPHATPRHPPPAFQGQLETKKQELRAQKEAAEAEAKRRSHEKVKVDGQIRELKAALKDALLTWEADWA